MARIGVTFEEIANAARELLAQGKQPTIDRVRQCLNDTGSRSTIAKYLKEWQAGQENGLAIALADTPPPEMIGMVKGFWERLSAETNQKVKDIEAKTQQEIAEITQELDKYKANNSRWQQLFNQWRQEKEQLLSDKHLLSHDNETQQKEIAVLNAKLDAQHALIIEKQLRIDELHRLHQQSQENLEHYRESAREQRLLEQAQSDQQKQELQQENKLLKEKVVILSDKITTLSIEKHNVEKICQLLQLECEQKEEKLKQLENENYERWQTIHHWHQDHAQHQKELNNELIHLIERVTEADLTAKKSNLFLSELKDIVNRNDKLQHENSILLQEKTQLERKLILTQKINE